VRLASAADPDAEHGARCRYLVAEATRYRCRSGARFLLAAELAADACREDRLLGHQPEQRHRQRCIRPELLLDDLRRIAANDFDSLLHGCGESRHANTPPTRMRTITTSEALKRVGQIDPAFKNHEPSLRVLADIRNGVVHAGASDMDGEGVFIPFLRACDLLIPNVRGATRNAFWGDFESSVDAGLSESLKEAGIAAVEAVAAARLAFEQHYGAMEGSAKEAALAAIEGSYNVEKYEQSLTDCPSCGQQALTDGSYEIDWDADIDVEGSTGEAYFVGAYPVVTYRPGHLQCRVCGLELDSEEQLARSSRRREVLEHRGP
jgi:hypothetical protein